MYRVIFVFSVVAAAAAVASFYHASMIFEKQTLYWSHIGNSFAHAAQQQYMKNHGILVNIAQSHHRLYPPPVGCDSVVFNKAVKRHLFAFSCALLSLKVTW